MTSRLQQTSNFNAGGLRFGARTRRIAAIACLVAVCGVIFGVGAALGRPQRGHFAPSGALVSLRIGVGHGARAGARGHRGGRHHHPRAHARKNRFHARMARDVRHHPGRRGHHHARRHHKHRPRVLHALMARDFSPALASATAALGQSITSLAGASASVNATSPAAGVRFNRGTRLLNRGLGSSQLNVLAGQVRATATYSPPARGSATAQRTAHKPASAHHDAQTHVPSGGFTFPFIPGPSQIERFVGVVPESLWIALASALTLAAAGGAAAVRWGRRARRQADEYAAVAAVALTDPLTGVLNRRGFGDAVERELARARRYGAPFALAYVDIRGLKAVNDSEGHLAGDQVIKRVARLLGESVRTEDSVGRLGGDELALLLTGQSAHGREAVVERIQARVPDCREAMEIETPWDVTVGMASYPADGGTFEELVSTADRRLYEQRGIQLR